MRPRPESEYEAEAQKFFKVEGTMYEAEARQQLSVYEHED